MAEAGIVGVKKWRIGKGITLQAIAASTKLSVRMLEAIECGDFKKLPGGIYDTNYLKQYAQAIGFDETELLSYYYEIVNPETADLHRRAQGAARDSRPRLSALVAGKRTF